MMGETLGDRFHGSCLAQGDKKAISFLRAGRTETVLSFLDLDRDAALMAGAFQRRGVSRGDRVILFLQKSLAFVVAHLALQKIGAVAVPLNPGFKKSEMEYLVRDARARLILLDPEKEEMIRSIDKELPRLAVDTRKPYQELDFFRAGPVLTPVRLQPDAPGLIIYTSGTTGNPKGAILTQGNLVHDARNVIRTWVITPSDVLCHALPLFHVHGLCFALHTALMAGSHVKMLDSFSPERVVEILSRNEGESPATVFMAVPSMYGKILDYMEGKRLDFAHVRLWTSGSAPLLVKDFMRIQEALGKEPVEREGMSETGMNFSNPLRGKKKSGSIGLPLPDLEVRIVDPNRHVDVRPGEIGEIWLRGPSITPGYWQKPEETAKAFIDGWFRTGDLGRVDEEGYYYLTDRIKHIIISGGENVSAKEVETVINQMDGVVESSVVGIPDEKWGEKVVAAVVTKSGSQADAEKIKAHCREHLHDWKCPKDLLFLDELPKNTMGKVLKEEVKNLFRK